MGTNIDLKKKFREYFYELEGFSLRSERFFDEFKFESVQEQKIIKWLEAAYRQGACDMAQDTVDTLGDYAAAVAGLKSEMVTPGYFFEMLYNESPFFTKYSDSLLAVFGYCSFFLKLAMVTLLVSITISFFATIKLFPIAIALVPCVPCPACSPTATEPED